MSEPRWRSRGYLPHVDLDEVCQFITFRLYDSLPKKVLENWKAELEYEDDDASQRELRERIEIYLDNGYGECWLRDPAVAKIVEDSLFYFDGEKYRLIAWVVMPNHVHILFAPMSGHSIAEIMHSIKSFSASMANRVLKRTGHFWQKEYYDRYIRDRRHLESVIAYIENNPVKARLCGEGKDWHFGSARFS